MHHLEDIHIAFAADACSHHLPRLTDCNLNLFPVLLPPADTKPASSAYSLSRFAQFQVCTLLCRSEPSLPGIHCWLLLKHRRHMHTRPPAQQPLLNQIASFASTWLSTHPLSFLLRSHWLGLTSRVLPTLHQSRIHAL